MLFFSHITQKPLNLGEKNRTESISSANFDYCLGKTRVRILIKLPARGKELELLIASELCDDSVGLGKMKSN